MYRLLESVNCDIAILTELRLPLNCADFPGTINNNYRAFPDHHNKSDVLCESGGLVILVNKSLINATEDIVITKSNRITGIGIHRENDCPVFIFGVYMPSDNNLQDYKYEVECLADIVEYYSCRGKIVLGGDFNAQYNTSPRSYAAQYKKEILRSWMSSNLLTPTNKTSNSVGPNHTFTPTEVTLDYIFVKDDLVDCISKCMVYDSDDVSLCSDHLAVFCHLSLPSITRYYRRAAIANLNWKRKEI